MYFAWLGFYTSAMVYPAVFGSVLYTFTEADQVLGGDRAGAGLLETPSSLGQPGQQLSPLPPPPDKPGCILCGLCPVQRGLVDAILGGVETEGGRASLQVGDAGLTWGSRGRATTPVQGKYGDAESKDSKKCGWRQGAKTGTETKLQYHKGCAKGGRSTVSEERGGKLDLSDREGCTRWGHCASKGTMDGNWERCGKGVWGRGSPLASCWARPLSSARACDASAL